MRCNYDKTIRILLVGMGLTLLCVAFLQVWVRCYNPDIRLPFYRRGNYMLTLMYGAILLVCVLMMKGQALGEAHLTEVIVSQCLSVLITGVIVYFPMSLLQYELLDPLPLVLLTLGQWLVIVLWNLLANRLYFKLVPPIRMLLICEDEKAEGSIVKKLNDIPEKYDVCRKMGIAQGKDAILAALGEYDAALVSVKDDGWRSWLVRMCFSQNVRLVMTPTLVDVVINSAKARHSVDTPLLCTTDHRLTIEERALKRTMDIVGAAVVLTVTSPLLLLCALAIKLCDKGPVFFRQERLTRDGRVFRIFKFRSMVVDAERQGQRLATEHDSRITPVGRVLRKLRLDEFPQLLNVLAGDMSLVGPRPECPAIAARYEKTLPEFAYRLKVKAGITGFAQVYGNYATDPADKLLMDIMYIERSNAVLDMTLILLTIRALFMTDKTKGAAETDA